MEARTCARINADRVIFQNFQLFSIKIHLKHVPTPPKMLGFHLNPSCNKTQAFISLKAHQNRRSKKNLEMRKVWENIPIQPLHPLKDGFVACKPEEATHSALSLHSSEWDGKHRKRECRRFFYTWVPLKKMKEFGEEEVLDERVREMIRLREEMGEGRLL